MLTRYTQYTFDTNCRINQFYETTYDLPREGFGNRCTQTVLLKSPYGYLTSQTTNHLSWWRHQMETFSALLAICAGNSPVSCEFPAQRPVTRSFDVFFDLCLNKRLSKQSWGWWLETLSCSLWRQSNDLWNTAHVVIGRLRTVALSDGVTIWSADIMWREG